MPVFSPCSYHRERHSSVQCMLRKAVADLVMNIVTGVDFAISLRCWMLFWTTHSLLETRWTLA
jgi:hypothetical protein